MDINTIPLNIIFDTDAGSDCDDMMALGYLLQAQKENKNMLDKRYKIDINAFSFLGILLTLQLPVSLDWKVLLSLIYLITGFWIEEEE